MTDASSLFLCWYDIVFISSPCKFFFHCDGSISSKLDNGEGCLTISLHLVIPNIRRWQGSDFGRGGCHRDGRGLRGRYFLLYCQSHFELAKDQLQAAVISAYLFCHCYRVFRQRRSPKSNKTTLSLESHPDVESWSAQHMRAGS